MPDIYQIGTEPIDKLTKREYFAIKIMQGLLVNYAENELYGNSVKYPNVANIAVKQADELLKELEK